MYFEDIFLAWYDFLFFDTSLAIDDNWLPSEEISIDILYFVWNQKRSQTIKPYIWHSDIWVEVLLLVLLLQKKELSQYQKRSVHDLSC